MRAEADASDAGARLAEAGRWPRLVGEMGWHRSDHPVQVFGDKLTAGTFTAADFAIDSLNHPDPISHASAALGVEVPIFTSGKIRSGIEAARGEAGAARARVRAAESDLITQITEAYFGVGLARAAAEVAESALSSAQSHERTAAARFGAGSSLKSDLLRAQVRRLERERDLERRRAGVELARARLRRLLQPAAGETFDLSTALEAPREPLGGLDPWGARAGDTRPEVEAARRAAQAAEAGARAARAALGPDLAGLARYERNTGAWDAGEGSYLLGVSVRWAAFDRGRAARIQAAEARATAAAAWSRAAEENVRLEVEEAFRDAEVAEHTLAAAREAAAAAEAARRISAERYAAGLLPLTDLLDIETALLEARLAEISALYDSVVGRVRLTRAAGLLEVPR
jgi:outer membrane protein TolC